jgi:hypothetical protein
LGVANSRAKNSAASAAAGPNQPRTSMRGHTIKGTTREDGYARVDQDAGGKQAVLSLVLGCDKPVN